MNLVDLPSDAPVVEPGVTLRSVSEEEVSDRVLRPGRRMWLPLVIFLGAVFDAVWGYFIQYRDQAFNYPINVGGQPYNSWPAFTVGTFEFMVLCAIAAGFFGLLAFCRLPRLYHPIFSAVAFGRASVDRFVLGVRGLRSELRAAADPPDL
jgi:Protein of unknown function (DUF3341)